jgi:HlyD family secretion protein
MLKLQKQPTKDASQSTLPRDAKPGALPKPVLLAFLIAILAGSIYYFYFKPLPPPATTLHVSGRIEGYETNIGPKIGGRVDYVAKREGELIKRGELLVKLADDDVQAQLRGAQARVLSAQEKASEAHYQLAVVDNQIAEAKVMVAQSQEDTAARVDQAEANVATSEAKVAEARALLAQAKSELEMASLRNERYVSLVKEQAISLDEADQARTSKNNAVALVSSRTANLEAARKQLKVSKAGLEMARTSRLNPQMRSSQLAVLQQQRIQAQFKEKSAEHEVKNTNSEVEQIKANIAYLNVNSPIDGVVTARSVEPGAVVVPGQNLLSLIDLSKVYLRGFVPEGSIGNVRIGQAASVYLDSQPKTPLEGEVIQIDPEGSFTPENIYFKEDRVKQVFGIKILLKHPDRFAKPGMPADAEISLAK